MIFGTTRRPSLDEGSATLRVGYLVSKYPAVSHTFILREVIALRARGIDIFVSSINDHHAWSEMTLDERVESKRTFYVKRSGFIGVAKAFVRTALCSPIGIFSALRIVVSLGRTDISKLARSIFYFCEALILADWMHANRLIHLHVHFATPAASVALILSSMSPVTFSITVHGPDEFYDVSGYSLREKIESASFVICISFFAQSQLMKLVTKEHWKKIEIARLGVDCSQFNQWSRHTTPKIFQILCVGRIVSAKGQHILLAAVEKLLEVGRSVRLIFVGDGPNRFELQRIVHEKRLDEHILFRGSVNQDIIRDFYEKADIFALASFAEGIPVVLMEAMAMGIPCITTSINGIPELIRDGIDGLLVPPSDVNGLVQAIALLMDDSRLRESIGKAGRVRILEQYELAKSADHLAEIFYQRLARAK